MSGNTTMAVIDEEMTADQEQVEKDDDDEDLPQSLVLSRNNATRGIF